MKSVFWLVPGVLAGRPGPNKAPWSPAEIRAAGFDAVLNLSEDEGDRPGIEAAGLALEWIPLPTDIPPTDESEQKCIEALPRAFAFLTTQLQARRQVLVHCYAGQDRTGMLLALWLAKKETLPAPTAIQRVRLVRPTAITAPGWEQLALRVIPRVLADL